MTPAVARMLEDAAQLSSSEREEVAAGILEGLASATTVGLANAHLKEAQGRSARAAASDATVVSDTKSLAVAGRFALGDFMWILALLFLG